MQRKWLIAIPILAALVGLCGLMALIVAYSLRDVIRWDVWDTLSFDRRLFGTVEVQETQELSYAVDSGAALVVENPCGSVDVRASAGAQGIKVTVLKRAWVMNEADGPGVLAAIRVRGDELADRLALGIDNGDTVCRNRSGMRTAAVDFTVEVPGNTPVTVRALAGEVTLAGLQAPADLKSDFGNLTAMGIRGRLTVESVNGRISLRDVDAGEDVVVVKSGFGSLSIENIRAGGLRLTTTNGTIQLVDAVVKEAVNLSSDFGNITWSGGKGGDLQAQTKNGRVELSSIEITGDADLSSDFGDILLSEARADKFDINTKNGKISVVKSIGAVDAHSDFGEIDVSVLEPALVNLSTESGGITFEGSLGDGENRLETRFGSVTLRLPQESTFSFDLRTSFGKITSDFELTVSGSPSEKQLQGTVGEGGPFIYVSTENGNITLEAR